jgi:hypothetical protein
VHFVKYDSSVTAISTVKELWEKNTHHIKKWLKILKHIFIQHNTSLFSDIAATCFSCTQPSSGSWLNCVDQYNLNSYNVCTVQYPKLWIIIIVIIIIIYLFIYIKTSEAFQLTYSSLAVLFIFTHSLQSKFNFCKQLIFSLFNSVGFSVPVLHFMNPSH